MLSFFCFFCFIFWSRKCHVMHFQGTFSIENTKQIQQKVVYFIYFSSVFCVTKKNRTHGNTIKRLSHKQRARRRPSRRANSLSALSISTFLCLSQGAQSFVRHCTSQRTFKSLQSSNQAQRWSFDSLTVSTCCSEATRYGMTTSPSRISGDTGEADTKGGVLEAPLFYFYITLECVLPLLASTND